MMRLRVNRITTLGMLCSVAILLGYIESFIVLPIRIPGIKIGLSNIVTVLALYMLGPIDAIAILSARVLLSGIMFGSGISIFYSACGALLSMLVMIILYKTKAFGVMGVSVAGGVFHNIGQIIAAAFVVGTYQVVYYLPVLIIAGCICGIIIGILVYVLSKRLRTFFVNLKGE